MFKLKLSLSFVAIYLVWGSSYLAARFVMDVMPGFTATTLRGALAALCLVICVGGFRLFKVPKSRIRGGILTGVLLQGLGTGPVLWAVTYVPTGITAMLVSVLPVWFILFERLFTGAVPLGRLGLVGMVISIVGSLWLTLASGAGFDSGVSLIPFLAIFFGCMCWALGSVWSTRVDLPENPFECLAWQMVGGVMCNGLLAMVVEWDQPWFYHPPDLSFLLALTYLVVGCSVLVFLGYNFLLSHMSPTLVSTHSYVNPVVALLLGWLVRDEVITGPALGASVMILAGVACIQWGMHGKKRPSPPETSGGIGALEPVAQVKT